MMLLDALKIERGDLVAIVGAGGKTSAMLRLAAEARARNWRVIASSTTRIAVEEFARFPQGVMVRPGAPFPYRDIEKALAKSGQVFVYSSISNGKVQGLSRAQVDQELASHPGHDLLLIEADGARRLPIKGAHSHEPVIPDFSSKTLVMAGLSALGQPLDNEHVYGADRVRSMLGLRGEWVLTPRIITALLLHPELGMRGIPPDAACSVLLNQATVERLPQAREIAAGLLSDFNVDSVLITTLGDNDPVIEQHKRIGVIVLAAGLSTRMGQPKMLLPWGEGSLVRAAVSRFVGGDYLETLVITGAHDEAIRGAIDGLPARAVFNPLYAEGEMLSSMQLGLRSLNPGCGACLLALGDQPNIPIALIQQLLEAYRQGKGRIIAPSYQNQRGHPILIDRELWPEFLALPPGSAPRDVIRAHTAEIHHIVVDDPAVVEDIDTPEDYRHARGESPNAP